MKRDMTAGREWKLIVLFTLPIMAGSVLQQLYNTVDGIIVGNFIGDKAFSGVGTCGALVFLFLSFAMGLGSGASVTVSQYFGARRYSELNAAIDTSIILIGAAGIFFSILGVATAPFLLKVVLNTPTDVLPYASLYFRIYSISLVFQFIYNGIAFILRGIGDSRASLYFLIVTTVVNAILALLFVIVFHWGVAGTATATVIAQAVCAVISYIYLKKRFTFENAGKHFDKTACRHILRYGLPSAFQQVIMSVGSNAIQRLVNGFGDVTMAAFTAGSRINMLFFAPIFGFQAGLATFTGQNIGAGRLDRVKRGLHSTLLMTLSLTVVVAVALYFFSPTLIALFDLRGDALARGVEMLRFYSFVVLAFSFQNVICGVLQGAGDIAILSLATMAGLVIRVAVGYLGVNFGFLGYNAAWVTDAMSWSALILVASLRYVSGKWKTKAVVSLPPETDNILQSDSSVCADKK